jgi:hypothetical protein
LSRLRAPQSIRSVPPISLLACGYDSYGRHNGACDAVTLSPCTPGHEADTVAANWIEHATPRHATPRHANWQSERSARRRDKRPAHACRKSAWCLLCHLAGLSGRLKAQVEVGEHWLQ